MNVQALEAFRNRVVQDVAALYDIMAAGIVGIDSMLGFYFELYGHCDGNLHDLVRSKMASLFQGHFKDGVQGLDRSRSERDAAEDGKVGLLGGEEVVRHRLESVSKTDELLRKAMVKEKARDNRGARQERRGGSTKFKSMFTFLFGY